jgi:hypothetical protein
MAHLNPPDKTLAELFEPLSQATDWATQQLR